MTVLLKRFLCRRESRHIYLGDLFNLCLNKERYQLWLEWEIERYLCILVFFPVTIGCATHIVQLRYVSRLCIFVFNIVFGYLSIS